MIYIFKYLFPILFSLSLCACSSVDQSLINEPDVADSHDGSISFTITAGDVSPQTRVLEDYNLDEMRNHDRNNMPVLNENQPDLKKCEFQFQICYNDEIIAKCYTQNKLSYNPFDNFNSEYKNKGFNLQLDGNKIIFTLTGNKDKDPSKMRIRAAISETQLKVDYHTDDQYIPMCSHDSYDMPFDQLFFCDTALSSDGSWSNVIKKIELKRLNSNIFVITDEPFFTDSFPMHPYDFYNENPEYERYHFTCNYSYDLSDVVDVTVFDDDDDSDFFISHALHNNALSYDYLNDKVYSTTQNLVSDIKSYQGTQLNAETMTDEDFDNMWHLFSPICRYNERFYHILAYTPILCSVKGGLPEITDSMYPFLGPYNPGGIYHFLGPAESVGKTIKYIVCRIGYFIRKDSPVSVSSKKDWGKYRYKSVAIPLPEDISPNKLYIISNKPGTSFFNGEMKEVDVMHSTLTSTSDLSVTGDSKTRSDFSSDIQVADNFKIEVIDL